MTENELKAQIEVNNRLGGQLEEAYGKLHALETERDKLLAEAIEREVLVERLRGATKDVLSSIPSDIFHVPQHEINHLIAVEVPDLLERALLQAPLTSIGAKGLELVKAYFNRRRYGDMWSVQKRLDDVAASFTEQDLKHLGVG